MRQQRGHSGRAAPPLDLRRVVAVTAAVLAVAAMAALTYHLLDVLLLLFLGIVVAAAVQPWHVRLCQRGVPKGWALLLVLWPFLVGFAAICFIVGPTLVEQVGTFANALPDGYESFRGELRQSASRFLRIVGWRMPSFDALTRSAPALSPEFFQGALQLTVGVASVFAYLVAIIAVAFYWTLELPRIERLVASLIPVARRARVLTIWHEIESTLGAFMRGQFVIMVIIGTAAGIGYALIGLPNVLMLAVLAGLLEAVPVIGPVLAAIPAVMVALPMGATTVGLTVAFAILLQAVENNVLLPRVMSEATGTSTLVGLLAVMAFGILYGVIGVFIAIPITAVAQVLLARALIEVEMPAEAAGAAKRPEVVLHARVQALQQRVRLRLRQRETRMGIDPDSNDHLVDAFDQQIETAIERIERLLAGSTAAQPAAAAAKRPALLRTLQRAIERLEAALADVAETTASDVAPNGDGSAPTVEVLSGATEQVGAIIARVDKALAAADSTRAETAAEPGPKS